MTSKTMEDPFSSVSNHVGLQDAQIINVFSGGQKIKCAVHEGVSKRLCLRLRCKDENGCCCARLRNEWPSVPVLGA